LWAPRSADARVLKSQLDLLADVVHSARLAGPAWAAILAFFGSAAFGHLGHVPLRTAAIFPALIALLTLLSDRLMEVYRRDAATHSNVARLHRWFSRFACVQAVVGATWGLLPWLLWDHPSSHLNYLFVWTCMVCALGSIIVNRAHNMATLAAAATPLIVLSAARFLIGFGEFDAALAVLLVACALLLLFDCRRMTDRLEEDFRLRFEVEDLARELEGARDEALRKRFEAENANASKTAFLANMSHELRTPLNAILGFSEIIARECFGPIGSRRYAEYAGDIHVSGSHLLSLINDLLDIAKIEAGHMELEPVALDMEKVFAATLKISAAKARERGQQLNFEVQPSAPRLYADERAVKQILINLLSNAVKFTPEGGHIHVVASAAPVGGFQLLVQDDGCGIPANKLDRIFKPFSQADNRYDRPSGGTGLGLALVRGLAELHGGRAWIESEPGQGCRAYVVLPAKTAAARPATIRQIAAVGAR
jgi:two-component system cell cycle sensor histidine kinase PleC